MKYFLTAIAYIVPTMFIGYTWHLIIFKDLYEGLLIYNRAEPIIPLGFLSMIIQGLLMAYFYPYFLKGKSTYSSAIKFSLIMGLFLFSVTTIANAAKIHVSNMQTWIIIQIAFTLLQFLVVGFMIGLVNNLISNK